MSEQARIATAKAKKAGAAAAGAENVPPAAAAALAAVKAAAPKDMPHDFVPTEMLLFCWLGPPSGKTIIAFSLQCSEGPPPASNKRPAVGSPDSSSSSSSSSESDVRALTQACVIQEAKNRSELRKIQKGHSSSGLQTALKESTEKMQEQLKELAATFAATSNKQIDVAKERNIIAKDKAEQQNAMDWRTQRISEMKVLIEVSEGESKKVAQADLREFVMNGLKSDRVPGKTSIVQVLDTHMQLQLC